jgi:hypothetical protein
MGGVLKTLFTVALVFGSAALLTLYTSARGGIRESSEPPTPTIVGSFAGIRATDTEERTVFRSKSNILSFHYPSDWDWNDTTPEGGSNLYGAYVQTGTMYTPMANVPASAQLPEGEARLELQIVTVSRELDLDGLDTCQMKTIECTVEELGGHPFNKAKTVLNTGSTSIVYETVAGTRYIRLAALVAPGRGSEERVSEIESLARSMTLSR